MCWWCMFASLYRVFCAPLKCVLVSFMALTPLGCEACEHLCCGAFLHALFDACVDGLLLCLNVHCVFEIFHNISFENWHGLGESDCLIKT